MVYRISNIDIRLLHVFRAVVECRGFTKAQTVLNVSQSTISGHISELESRLGIRLCERGRSGFRLTSKGKRVHEETLQLFSSLENFQNITQELKGKLSGFLNIGVIDSIVTDASCPLIPAIKLLNEKTTDVTIRLDIMIPDELERTLLESGIDVAIGTFDRKLAGLDYASIYLEENELFCGLNHPITRAQTKKEIKHIVRSSRKVTRDYLEGRDIFPLGANDGVTHAHVRTLEAAAILILGGGHIGFLPRHYATRWAEPGEMISVLPADYKYVSEFFIVTRKKRRKSVIIETFLSNLRLAMNEIRAQARHDPRLLLNAAGAHHDNA